MAQMEQGGFERHQPGVPSRRKGGLETPLEGRFAKENRRLVFAPPLWYDLLVGGCFFGGLGLMALSFLAPRYGYQSYGTFVGAMLAFAGAWGALSNERMSCNLTARSYARLEGQGLRKRLVQGSLAELDALVLVSEEQRFSLGVGRSVMYRLVLYWKGQAHPLLVVEREAQMLAPGAPIQSGVEAILRRGQVYAHALGVRLHDNSYCHSPCPVPVV